MFGTGDIITDDGLNEIYYDFIREKIKERFYNKNGLKDGIFQRFDENGKVLEKGKLDISCNGYVHSVNTSFIKKSSFKISDFR
tara:strand:- start:324 stop:572 length:249 start_codon:yes stop_codon:yes gene_type:complete